MTLPGIGAASSIFGAGGPFGGTEVTDVTQTSDPVFNASAPFAVGAGASASSSPSGFNIQTLLPLALVGLVILWAVKR